MGEKKKDCYHCMFIRPLRGNYCRFVDKKVADIHSFVCNDFQVDTWIERLEENMEKKDDEGSKRLRWLFYGLTSKPIFA
jgi:hypothetical protein